MNWLLASFLSNFSFAFQSLISYKLSSINNYNTLAMNTSTHAAYLFLSLIISFFVFFINPKSINNLTNNIIFIFKNFNITLFFYALLSLLGNSILYFAYSKGKQLNNINPGIASTLSNFSLIISIALPYYFYNMKINTKNLIGIIVYLISVFLLSHTSSNKKSDDKNKNNSEDKSINTKNQKDEKNKNKHHENKDHENKDHENKNVKNTSSAYIEWMFLCLLSAISYGLAAFLSYTIIHKNKNINKNSLTISLFIYEVLIGLGIYLFFTFNSNAKYNHGFFKNHNKDLHELLTNIKNLPFVFGSAIFNATGLITLYKGYAHAPNPGFVDAISNLYTTTQSILNWILFKTPLNNTQIVGLVFASISIFLMNL